MAKNKIISIIIVVLSLVMIAGLFFLLFSSLKTIVSEFEAMPESNYTETGAVDGSDVETTESSSGGSSNIGDLVTITLDIDYLYQDGEIVISEDWTTEKKSYKKGQSYSIDIPDYSEQGFYAMCDYNLTGTATANKTIRILYTNFKSSLDNCIVKQSGNCFELYIGGFWGSYYDFVELTNNTSETINDFTVVYYQVPGGSMSPNKEVCSMDIKGYSIKPGESLFLFMDDSSFDDNLPYDVNKSVGYMILGKMSGQEYYTYKHNDIFESTQKYYHAHREEALAEILGSELN